MSTSSPATTASRGARRRGAPDTVSTRDRARRFRELLGIARRHGLLPWRKLDFTTSPETSALRTQQADGLRQALQEAGGGFVKLGQLLSTRNDLLPIEWVRALSRLQREVQPAPWDEVEAMLDAEYGVAWDAVFRTLDPVLLAAASIAQVHRGELFDGSVVAVKVERPGIEPLLRRDVDIMYRLADLIARASPRARRSGIGDIARQYGEDLLRQLDFRQEARNLLAIRSVEARSPRAGELRLPELVEDLTTGRVLVMELLQGETVTELNARMTGDDLSGAMRIILRSLLRQIVFDGVFHADLHPGNVLILDDGQPAMVDFGSVGRLDMQLRETAQELIVAFLQGDNQVIADCLIALAPLKEGADERAFRRQISEFMTNELGPGATISVETVDTLVDIIEPYGMAMPPELVSAARAFAIFEGTLRSTVPDFDVLEEARQLANEQIQDQMTFSNMRSTVTGEVFSLMPGIRRLPRRFDRIGQAIENGTLNVNVRLLADRRDRKLLRSLIREIVLASVGIAAGIIAVGLLTAPPVAGATLSGTVVGYALAGVSVAGIAAAVADAFSMRNR